MLQPLADFIKNLTYWLKEEHEIEVTEVKKVADNTVELALTTGDDEGGDAGFYVGNFADPGIRVVWLGEHDFGTPGLGKVQLIGANGVVMQALGRHVAGWAVGYS